ncbi:MAG: 1-(5-phosphoribosyl)-5-[(5-phosphoribosylamino)methylideneamino]imidazole-4-carboxamide isomerase [Candidatus Dormibacteria bacterium]
MLVIPAIDLLGGRTVRLAQGDYQRVTQYQADPVTSARSYAAAGALRVHLVDLDAARGDGDNQAVIADVIRAAGVEVEVGGGVRSRAALARLLEAGASQAVIGTAAVEHPDEVLEWAAEWPGRVLIGIDARDGIVATHGWKRSGELTVADLVCRYEEAPIAGFVFTDIGRDGLLEGVSEVAIREVVAGSAMPVTVGGGVTTTADIRAAAAAGAAGAIVGRAIYEGRLTVEEAISAATG